VRRQIAAGKYRQVPYGAGMVDCFSALTAAGSTYLIPFEVVAGKNAIVLDHKYGAFEVK